MSEIDYIELGGTLFVPALHKDVEAIALHKKYSHLKSMVIDTEDGLNESSLEEALKNIEQLLPKIKSLHPYIFLRPRNTELLRKLLQMNDIENVTGFVLPKFSLSNMQTYMSLLKGTRHFIMPSIEGNELFNHSELHTLKNKLLEHKERVLIVRFGLEDMLSSLGMRRSCTESTFDFSATNMVLGNFIATFKSAGFGVSGGVYPCFKDKIGFLKDAKRDLKEGLFSKTIIHPSQIEAINELYSVSKEEFLEAQSIIKSAEAVFSLNGKMAEKNTMYSHSLIISRRRDIYGISKTTTYNNKNL
jgi:citrate lyase beta subunit